MAPFSFHSSPIWNTNVIELLPYACPAIAFWKQMPCFLISQVCRWREILFHEDHTQSVTHTWLDDEISELGAGDI